MITDASLHYTAIHKRRTEMEGALQTIRVVIIMCFDSRPPNNSGSPHTSPPYHFSGYPRHSPQFSMRGINQGIFLYSFFIFSKFSKFQKIQLFFVIDKGGNLTKLMTRFHLRGRMRKMMGKSNYCELATQNILL